MEDAYVLADEISKNDYKIAFKNYFDRRKDRVNFILTQSKFSHRMLKLPIILTKMRNYFIKLVHGRIFFRLMDNFLRKKI